MPPDCEEKPGANRSREQVFKDRFIPLIRGQTNGSNLHNPCIGDELPINNNTDLGLSDNSEDRSDANIVSVGLSVDHHHRKILMNRKRRILASSGNFSLVCKICSKEFSTGRALGGHMRIHGNNSSKSEDSEDSEEEANWSAISDQMNEKKKKKIHLESDIAERFCINRPHESLLMDDEEEEELIVQNNYDYQTTHPNHDSSKQSINGDGDKLFCVDQFGRVHNSNKQTGIANKKKKKKKKYYYMSKEYSHGYGDDLHDRHRSAGFASEAKDQETLISGKDEKKKKKQKNEPARDNMDLDHKGGRSSSNGSNICPVCSRDFMSQKALFGHMRSHPERQWRGIQPPAQISAQISAQILAHQDNDRLSNDSNPNSGRSNGSSDDLSASDVKSSTSRSSSASSHQLPYNHHRFKLVISNTLASKSEAHHPQVHEDQIMHQEEEPEAEAAEEEEGIHPLEEIQEAGFDDQIRLLKDVEVESGEKRLPAASDSNPTFVHLVGMMPEESPHDQCNDGHDQDGINGNDGDGLGHGINGSDGDDGGDGHGHGHSHNQDGINGNDGHGHGGMMEVNDNKPEIIMKMKRHHHDHDIDLARCLLLLSNGGIDHQDQEDQDQEAHKNGVNQVPELKQPNYIVPGTDNHLQQLLVSESTATTTNGDSDPFAWKRPDTILFGSDLNALYHRQVSEYSGGHAIQSDQYSIDPNDTNEYGIGPNGTFIIGEASGVSNYNGLHRVLETMKMTQKQEGPLHIISSDIINVRKVHDGEEEEEEEEENDDDNDMNVIYENEVHVKHDSVLRLYVCSGCKKSFGSPQALGGHRASHKKKNGCYAKDQMSSITSNNAAAAAYNNNRSSLVDQEQQLQQQQQEVIMHGLEEAIASTNNRHSYANIGRQEDTSESLGLERMKKKYSAGYGSRDNISNTNNMHGHECSVCHRVFPTGQALGGHKRCHWTGPGKPPPHVAGAHQNNIDTTSSTSSPSYKGVGVLIDRFIREGHHGHPISSPIQQLSNAAIGGLGPYTAASTAFNDSKVSVIEGTEHHNHHHYVGLDLNLPAPLDDDDDDGDDDGDAAKNSSKVEYMMIKSHNDDGDGNNSTFRQSCLHSFMPGLCPPPSDSNRNPQQFDTNWSRTPTLINYPSFNRD